MQVAGDGRNIMLLSMEEIYLYKPQTRTRLCGTIAKGANSCFKAQPYPSFILSIMYAIRHYSVQRH